MAREIKFIISIDLDAQTSSIDDGSFTIRYQDWEQVWNTDTQDWQPYKEGEYDLALQILNTKKLEDD